MQLTPGQNAPLRGDPLVVGVTGPVDLTGLVLNADGKVASDADMVFFNQPAAPGIALDGARMEIALAGLRPGADQVALVASPEVEDVRFGELPPISITVRHGDGELSFEPVALGTETALVLCTVYRRGDGWKLRAVGQGYSTGLVGVATDYGIEIVDDDIDGDPEPAPAGTSPDPTAPDPVEQVQQSHVQALSGQQSHFPEPEAGRSTETSRSIAARRPLGAVRLARNAGAVIPLPADAADPPMIQASLHWTGRRFGGSSADLDLYALYINDQDDEGAVHFHRRGQLTTKPWIWLDQDARRPGVETITIVPGRQPWILLCAHSATGNGIGSFRSHNAHLVVDDGRGSTITVPLYRRNKFSNWVAIALLDATDPDGLRVTQVERYGESFSERRPLLHPDGTFEMSKGVLPREKRRR